MLNGACLVSDLHLDDSPNVEYRWSLFQRLEAIFTHKPYLDSLWILGDLTDRKNSHDGKLVNRLVDSLVELRRGSKLNEVHILAGNHDGLEADKPYFAFLNIAPWCHFYSVPTVVERPGNSGTERIQVLPHTRNPKKAWRVIEWNRAHVIMLHGTVAGSASETGHILDGIGADFFDDVKAKVFAGDVHVPQKVGRVEYVGAPYPIRFGDKYEGRAITFPLGKREDVPLPNIRRAKIHLRDWADIRGEKLGEGDQIKVELTLRASERHTWVDQKEALIKWCRKQKIDMVALAVKTREVKKQMELEIGVPREKPVQIVRRYAKATGIDKELRQIGEEIVE